MRDPAFGGPGEPVATPSGSGTLFEVGEALGTASGQNLFHGFSHFDVGTGDTVRFTADPGASFRNVITRVTGGPSQIDGTLESAIPGADFYFVNPRGVVFGENARIDVPASFHASSADFLRFGDGTAFDATGTATATLSSVDPVSFGFFGDGAGAIESRGLLQVGDGQRLALVGGDIRIEGGGLFALGGEVLLSSVASGGEVGIGGAAPELPTLSGVERRGDITLSGDAIISSSGLSPFRRDLNVPGDLESRLIRVRVDEGPADQPFSIPEGATLLSETVANGIRQIRFYVTNEDAPALARNAGTVLVQAEDLVIEDADIETLTVGADSGSIQIDLTGDLAIRQESSPADAGIFARTGAVAGGYRLQLREPVDVGCAGAVVACRVVDPATGDVEYGLLDVDLTDNTGSGGDIRIAARNVQLENGGRIASTSLGGGSPGDIALDVLGEVSLSGASPFSPASPDAIPGSAIVTNHQGEPAGPAGQAGGAIEIQADRLVLLGPSGLFAQTSGNGDAGDIHVGVRRLEVLDTAQIDSSTSGQSLPAGSNETTTGSGGTITVEATEAVVLAGRASERDFARLSTFSQARSQGGAGSIRVTTPLLALQGGAGIAVTTEGEGAGGDIVADVGEFRSSEGASVSARSESREQPAGDVTIMASGSIRLDSGSEINASTGIASGGNIVLASGDVMFTGERSAIRAEAVEKGGSGGRVVIAAPLLVRSASSVISAAAPGGPEVQGEVEINSPVVFLEEPARPPDVGLLDASSLLLSQCAARRSGDRAGRFEIANWPGLPAAQEGPLLAFETIFPLDREELASRPGDESPALPEISAGPPTLALAQLLRSGERAFRGGRLDTAALAFARAAEIADNDAARGDALRGLAQTRQQEGDYANAVVPLEQALELARARGDAAREAAALGQLGNAYVAVGELERAGRTLEAAVARARTAGDPEILTLDLNHLGNLRSRQGDYRQAAAHYDEAAGHAEAAGDALRAAQSWSNAAYAALEQGKAAPARTLLGRAVVAAGAAEAGSERSALQVHLAQGHAQLARLAPRWRRPLLSRAHRLLLDASAEAGATGDEQLRSRALGGLGGLYGQEGGRAHEAMYLTRRALESAEAARSPMLLARWSRQAAHLAWDAGRPDEALVDHRRAVALLDSVHPETRARYGGAELGFQRAVEPVYLDLVDALLRHSDERTDQRQALLAEARDTVERWKAAELRDYFRDDCVAAIEAQERPLEQVAPAVAVVYPILLDDRVELLVGTQRGLSRHVVPVAREEVVREVAVLRELLEKRTTSEFRSRSRALHAWLVAPYQVRLDEEGIDTLVFVPDRVLRTIPPGALHDGRQFLIQRYAVAVTPTLQLLAPRRIDPERTRFLLAGLSQPVQGFEALEHVPEELRAIQRRFGGEVLLDEGFQTERFETALRERRPGVVHIASHAHFGGDARDSFVLTHDGRLGIRELSRLMAGNRFGEQPIELLLLSACETATGDPRAALGLAGLAVQAGARSALGSLWQVDDEATSRLISAFYAELETKGVSKAEAFARAQRGLLAERRFQHPFYWAGFMVINNWL